MARKRKCDIAMENEIKSFDVIIENKRQEIIHLEAEIAGFKLAQEALNRIINVTITGS